METVTTTTLTTSEAAAAGAIIGGFFGVIFVGIIIFYILTVIACWKIFEKAGEKGWKALIPIYNTYIMFKIVNMKGWFWFVFIASIIGSIIASVNNSTSFYYASGVAIQTTTITEVPVIVTVTMIIECIIAICAGIIFSWRMSKVFGHGVGYFIGLLFLPNIFWLILGFGKSKYNKKALKA